MTSPALRPLRNVRILSLALNLPGPAALMRCKAMGARCSKLEPPSGDPMRHYSPAAYARMHAGIRIHTADLKSAPGQEALQALLAKTDVLVTSFRPSALRKLGLNWKALRKAYPALSLVSIVGASGARAEEPGHDLTYLAEHGLVTGLDLPPTLYADMGGSLMTSEAVLRAVMAQRADAKGMGVCIEVALADAAQYLALPRAWGLTLPDAPIGGAHAGYRVYACKDGRVAVAALEPHFARALCVAAGLAGDGAAGAMGEPRTHKAIAAFLKRHTRKELDALSARADIPLFTLPARAATPVA